MDEFDTIVRVVAILIALGFIVAVGITKAYFRYKRYKRVDQDIQRSREHLED